MSIIYTGSHPPINPAVNDAYMDTSTGEYKTFDGTNWISLMPDLPITEDNSNSVYLEADECGNIPKEEIIDILKTVHPENFV